MNDFSSSELSRGSRLCTRRGAALTNTGDETWQRFILKFVFFEALPQCCPGPKAQPGRYAPGPGGCFLMFAETRQMDAYEASCASRTHPTPSFKNVSIGVIRSASFLTPGKTVAGRGIERLERGNMWNGIKLAKICCLPAFFCSFVFALPGCQAVRKYCSALTCLLGAATRVIQSCFKNLNCLDSRTL